MSLQRHTPTDTLQKIMSSFKHFEKKLDKLQEDVNYHGHTLSELRVMVANLSAGTLITPDTHIDSMKRSVNNTAIQYDERFHIEGPGKNKKKMAHVSRSKIAGKNFDIQKYETMPKESPYKVNKLSTNLKNTGKYFPRHRKAEAPRKATTLRTEKATNKKLINIGSKATA